MAVASIKNHIVLKVPRDGTDAEICRWRGEQRLTEAEADRVAAKWANNFSAYSYISVKVE